MPQHELITYMTRPEPGRIGSERPVHLPLEIKILTYYNSWLMDWLWETKVIGTDLNGSKYLIQSHSTPKPPEMQHNDVVGFYRERGYKVVEHRVPLTDAELGRLEELLNGIPGLD